MLLSFTIWTSHMYVMKVRIEEKKKKKKIKIGRVPIEK
jgi:hypothetical protein